MKKLRSIIAATAAVCLATSFFTAADWPRFRGEQAGGTADKSDAQGAPLRWAADKNVVWKTAMPGPGASSPIVVDGKIFLTAYSGYGIKKDDPGKQADLRRHLLCLDRRDGKLLWQQSVKAELPEEDYKGFMLLHGYASSTPVSDGKNVYAFFGRSGVYAYTIDGKELWHTHAGSGLHGWGSAASPILYKDLLIVNAGVESGTIVALDKLSGQKRWAVDGIRDSWSTPLVVSLPGGKDELVVSMHGRIAGLDPSTGKQLWTCKSVEDYVCTSVIAGGDTVFVCSGRRPTTLAVRCGGRGDVSDTHLVWQINKTPRVSTPLYREGRLYWLDGQTTLCVDAKTGKTVAQQRIGGFDTVYASPVLADGRIYAVSREKGALVLSADPSLKELARNDLGDASVFNGTPAVNAGQLLIRSDAFLYCIGE